ncbi:MAG: hypothetical protein JRK26_17920 [Deltaproteobacteria bacterium]|nr:hypothetical protein [Deltaproteobacteria bacterium]
MRIMKVKEKIHAAVDEMGARELSKIYDYIEALKRMKTSPPLRRVMPIERIHEMTRRSRTSWADAVLEDREDRL